MSMKKRKLRTGRDFQQRVWEKITIANSLIKAKHWPEAREALEELDRELPGDPVILGSLVNVYFDLHDMIGYQYACERLLKADPSQVEMHMGLAGAYLSRRRKAIPPGGTAAAQEASARREVGARAPRPGRKRGATIRSGSGPDFRLAGAYSCGKGICPRAVRLG